MSKEKETGKEKGRIRQLARYYIPYKGLFFTDMLFCNAWSSHYTGDSADCTVYYEYGCGKAAGAGNG